MDIEELIQCMQEEELFRTNCNAQKILEDADMYAKRLFVLTNLSLQSFIRQLLSV